MFFMSKTNVLLKNIIKKNYYHYLDSMRILKIRDIEENAQEYPG